MSAFDRDQAEVFLELVFGGRTGTVCLAFGRDPYLNDDGKYRHRSWSEGDQPRTDLYRWPDERDRLLGDVAREMAGGPVDVYVCPALRHAGAKSRRKGDALPAVWAWADLDGPAADPVLLDKLGPLVVRSGSDDHRHVYVALDAAASDYGGVPVAGLQNINRALARLLGGDAKWSDESLLRLPGTLNHKSAPPAPVALVGTGHRVWPVGELSGALFDADPDNTDDDHGVVGSPVDSGPLPSVEPLPDLLPGPVLRALAKPSGGDRSADAARVIEACAFARLTEGQALSVLRDHSSAAHYKDARHAAQDVARLYRKFAPPENGPHNPQNHREPGAAEGFVGSVVQWDPPTPLPTLPPLVEFPADALPDWVRDWCGTGCSPRPRRHRPRKTSPGRARCACWPLAPAAAPRWRPAAGGGSRRTSTACR